jgi:hypothetical protein
MTVRAACALGPGVDGPQLSSTPSLTLRLVMLLGVLLCVRLPSEEQVGCTAWLSCPSHTLCV